MQNKLFEIHLVIPNNYCNKTNPKEEIDIKSKSALTLSQIRHSSNALRNMLL